MSNSTTLSQVARTNTDAVIARVLRETGRAPYSATDTIRASFLAAYTVAYGEGASYLKAVGAGYAAAMVAARAAVAV